MNTRLIDVLKKISGEEGKELVLWSSRGRQYAEQFAESQGITDLFVAIVGKPTTIIDDVGWSWAARFVPAVRPNADTVNKLLADE